MRLRLAHIALLMALAAPAGDHARGAIAVDRGVVYAQGSINAHTTPQTTNLLLDVYRPADPADVTGNALVLIHGGSFETGDRTSIDMVDAAAYFANRGWTCFSIDYRLMPDDPPAPAWVEALGDPLLNAAHAAMVDAKRAIRWVRMQAAAYGCSSNRVAGLGHSAGAFCVIQTCITDEDDYANDGGTSIPDQWAGYSGRLNAGVEVSGGTSTNVFEFDSGDPPLMLWHSLNDDVVPYAQALAVRNECIDHRIPHRLCTVTGVLHGAATWTALYEGRGVKEHASDFLNLFFDLHVSIEAETDTVTLTWPSVSNAVYDIRSAPHLPLPSTHSGLPVVTSAADLCTAVVPALQPTGFYRVGIRSGQP